MMTLSLLKVTILSKMQTFHDVQHMLSTPIFGNCKGVSDHFWKLSISKALLFILYKTISVGFNTASVYL